MVTDKTSSTRLQPKVFNISSFSLGQHHLKLLSHGTKFTPVTKGNYVDAKKCTDDFIRKLKIKYAFHDEEYEDDSLCRNKSTKQIRIHDDELNQILKKIESVEPTPKQTSDNLSEIERKALRELMDDNNLVIKEADKGGALIIMNNEFYKNKLVLKDHLSNTDTYKKIPPDADKKTMQKLIELVQKHDGCLTAKEKEYVKDQNWRSSEFYIRPKVHKCKTILEEVKKSSEHVLNLSGAPDLSGRPIVAGTKAPTRHLSDLISEILRPIVETQTSYVKDDWDYLRKLPRKLNGKFKLFGCDITSLYTSIPHELGLKAVEYWLKRSRHLIKDRFTNEFILESIEFLLKNNNFVFDNEMYNQLKGTAMGASFAAFYACLTIGYLEETKLYPKLQQQFSQDEANIIKETYKRFMDDGIVFLPWTACKDTFLALLNEMDPSIKFTLENTEQVQYHSRTMERLNFLDLSIILDDQGAIHTDVHYKPTNSHDYLHYDSFHPEHTLNNIPYCLAKRIIVFCSDETVMENRLKEMKRFLKQCDYPDSIIDKGIHNAKLQGPAPPKPTKDNIIPYVHQNMSNLHFKHILQTTSKLLQNARSEEIREVFKETRFIEAVKQPRNILRTLTSNKTVDQETPGLFAECNPNRCELCRFGYIQNCTTFTTTNGTEWTIKSHINCNSRNVVYYLECLMCNGQMTKTGKTKTRLRERINNHRSESRSGKTTDVFDMHCHKCGAHKGKAVEPYFRVRAFMKLNSPEKLLTYEKLFHERQYAVINQ